MEDIIIIVKSLEDSSLLLKAVSEIIQNETKYQKGGYLGTLVAKLWGNMLTEWGVNRAGDGIIRAGYGSEGSSIKKSPKNIDF